MAVFEAKEWLIDTSLFFGKTSDFESRLEFDFEKDLIQTNDNLSYVPSQYEKGGEVCAFYKAREGSCGRGSRCPYRHNFGSKTIVCKHWLRGLCKKGPQCEFLHQYDMGKMPP